MRREKGFLESKTIIFLFLISSAFIVLSAAQAPAVSYPTIKPWGFTQIWNKYDNTAGSTRGEDFQIARARIGLKGALSPLADYMLLTEWGYLTYDDPVTLLDAWVNFKFNPALNIKVGQTWYKFTLSGTTPLPQIPFICRPEVIDGIFLTMGRNGSYSYDRGIEFSGTLKARDIPWGYIFSVTAGSGLDQFENNGKKDLVGRVWFEPIKDVRLGASGFYGHSRVEIVSNLNREVTRDTPEYAMGSEFSYTKKQFRGIAEYVQGLYEGYLDVQGAETFHLATQKPRGWYAMAGFKPVSWLEIPVQYAWYEKDAVRSNTGLQTITLGITWFLKGDPLNNVKLNYLIRSAEENYGSKPRNMVLLQLQLGLW